jgi:hypothetical protein
MVLGVLAAACGDNLNDPFALLVQVSDGTPFGSNCAGTQQGFNFAGVEVEPSLAVDPTDANHLVGAWQQDRWSNGGANGIGVAVTLDGGATWTTNTPRMGQCGGGSGAGGGYERATDPWVAFAADGTVFLFVLEFNSDSAANAMVASRSVDGGVSWSDPTVLRSDDDPDVFNDKNTITADPTDAGRLYAVWDRITGQTHPTQPTGTGPAWFARTSAGVWETARPIYDPGLDAQTLGNVLAVLPDGTLVDAFDLITATSSMNPVNMLAVVRSTDHGLTWSDAKVIAAMRGVGVEDPSNHVFIRSGADLPQIAVDRTSGALYIVWQDAPASGSLDQIMIVSSVDGGASWTPPVTVNGVPTSPAFTPSVAVAADGTVGVTYFDMRDARLTDPDTLAVTPWLATSRDRGQTWSDEALSQPFNLRPALLRDFYFLGDYQGLVASGNTFVPFFVAATSHDGDRTDVFTRPIAPTAR